MTRRVFTTAGGWRRSGIAVVLAAMAACTPARPEPDFVQTILAARAQKDREFREARDSPVPLERRREMLPLSYFSPDAAYKVAAALERDAGQRTVEMPTSTGVRRKMRVVGVLAFNLKGRPLALTAFADATAPTDDRLFVPFTDLTSGTETYAGGRYIDLDRNRSGIYEVDFNRAYHPFCYYDSRYDCPFPPASNRLQTPVRAGERLPI